METKRTCPSCGKEVPADVPQGLCPECLLKTGFPTGVEPGGEGAAAAPTPVAPPPIEEIQKLFPQLQILELLGRGGMGAVYKARQSGLDRLVALKILIRRHREGAPDPAFAERFAREARALARLNHQDIVAIYDYGEAGGYPYLVMEFVDGLTLRQLLQHGKLAPDQALALVPKICEALQFAHQQGIIHRDIKPENILLDKTGRVKIADFGIAKIVGSAEPAHLTRDEHAIGTPHYMAPEQIERPRQVDHRADIFSLGVVFYEMLTGELPLGKFAPPSRKVQVDVRLDEVVLHALEKEPDRRYQHVSEVKTDVEAIARGPRQSPPPQLSVPNKSTDSVRIAKYFAISSVVILLGLILLGGLFAGSMLLSVRQTEIRPEQKTANLASESPAAETSPASAPPVVVHTIPESGAADVDPSLTELQVTFSKPMLDKSWSWAWEKKENFPERTGDPRCLADGRTCVLPVKLAPGHVYAVWINTSQFTGFQDRNGNTAIPYLLIFQTKP